MSPSASRKKKHTKIIELLLMNQSAKSTRAISDQLTTKNARQICFINCL